MADTLEIFGKTYTGVESIKAKDDNGVEKTYINPSDTTATESQVLSGYYFHKADGSKVQGNITSQASQTITPGTTDQTIASGKYLSGTQTIKGDADLIAGNIKNGVEIFGVIGTYEGSGRTTVDEKDVNFYDYDGACLYSYSASDFASLTALPANPVHDGLTAQGWNWSLSDAKTYVANYGKLDIGQMYITSSGNTEIDVIMLKGRLEPTLSVSVNGTIFVNWGDNTTSDTVTGTSLSTKQSVSHTYANAGSYTITISVSSGSFSFYCSSSVPLLSKNDTTNENYVYANCIQAVRIGTGITTIADYSFRSCQSLSSITLPSSIVSIKYNAFYYCYSLKSITIPSTTNGISISGSGTFECCYSLKSIAFPKSISGLTTYMFRYCYNLKKIAFPSSISSITEQALINCYSICSITIPDSITTIGVKAFTTCRSLSSITLPSSITTISEQAFSSCYGVKEYHIKPTTPPTLANTNAFSGISSDCIIYVPSASLNSYQTANVWSNYASYMVGE